MHAQHQKAWSTNPYVLMPILLLMWGSVAAVSKLLLGRLDSYQLLFYMYGIGAAVFALIVLSRGGWSAVRRWTFKAWLILAACGLFTFLYDFLYFKALERIPAVEASMLNYLFPIFIVVLALPMNKERPTGGTAVAVLMGLAGTWLLMTEGNMARLRFTDLAGDLYAIGAAVSWGVFTNLLKWNKQDAVLSAFAITCFSLLLAICALAMNSGFAWPARADFYGAFWLAMSNVVLGFFLYLRALSHSPATLIAGFTFFTPVVTLAFIFILLGEPLTPTDGMAALLILLSMPAGRIRFFSRRRSDG
ncbi:DMT family transporter [Paenibacillus methanolicus]|uniref:EamA domain-containing membrane protein RarD n=1 Tax=Paenibacillus methanolicus TaxID=582686 RepID=A0A5S5C8Q9_9BACL|nr:DMT family transporter [Paenibacillus methanolicus]TYP74872.1 EamA domain-containing membrane protein RarD [Paenibacillus methanolicus]